MDSTIPNSVGNTDAAWRPDDQHSFFLAAMIWVLIVLMIVPEGFDYQSLTAAPDAPTSGGAISRWAQDGHG